MKIKLCTMFHHPADLCYTEHGWMALVYLWLWGRQAEIRGGAWVKNTLTCAPGVFKNKVYCSLFQALLKMNLPWDFILLLPTLHVGGHKQYLHNGKRGKACAACFERDPCSYDKCEVHEAPHFNIVFCWECKIWTVGEMASNASIQGSLPFIPGEWVWRTPRGPRSEVWDVNCGAW